MSARWYLVVMLGIPILGLCASAVTALSGGSFSEYWGFANLTPTHSWNGVAQLGIPDALDDHTATADQLARVIGANTGALKQLLRVLVRAGLCTQSGDDFYSLTPLGAALRSDAPNSMRGWVMFAGSQMYLRTWEQLSYSVRTGKPGFERAHGAAAFEYLSKHPEAQSIFDAAMTAASGPEAEALVAAYDFSASRRVVDVGGGHGALLARILKANPHSRGAVFEQPQVLGGTRSYLERQGLLERCDLIEGSFFESVPGGYDTYVLKYIVHDWNDEKASQILRNCRRVIANESKLVLMESVISRTSTDLSIVDDLQMLVFLGSKERSEEEFGELLKEAGFELKRIIPTACPLSIIEAIAA